MYNRKPTKKIMVGGVAVGGNSPITIQSMTNTKTADIESTVSQIDRLADEGCEIIRVAANDMDAAHAIKEIKRRMKKPIPLIADIHYDYRLALAALEAGADKLRLNPGNLRDKQSVALVAKRAKELSIPIRIGVNSGSVSRDIVSKYGGITPEGLVECAMSHITLLEEEGFYDIIIAIKASAVTHAIHAYEKMSGLRDYPLHVGITEAGTEYSGTVKSACGIGAILSRGIGDTIRVSLTEDPAREIICAKEILKSLGLRRFGIEIVSCPTCGRTDYDMLPLVKRIEEACEKLKNTLNSPLKPMKVAIMGCVVNGPGEARDADLGIAGGKDCGILFKNGEIYNRNMPQDKLFSEFMKEIELFQRGSTV